MKNITKLILISFIIVSLSTSVLANPKKGIEFKYNFKTGDTFKVFENSSTVVTFNGNDNTSNSKTTKQLKILKNDSNIIKIEETLLESSKNNNKFSKLIGKSIIIKIDFNGNNIKNPNKVSTSFLIPFPSKKISPGYSWVVKSTTKSMVNIGPISIEGKWKFEKIKKTSTSRLAYFTAFLKTYNNSRTSIGKGTFKVIFDIDKGYCIKGKLKHTVETNGDFGNGKIINIVTVNNDWELIPQVEENNDEW